MYYELYVDVLFLVNCFMDYILLLFVWKTLHCKSSHKRILLGAVIGAFFTCVLIILPIPNAFLENILFHLIVNTCMIKVGLKIKNMTIFLRAFLLLYIGSVLMGGILNALAPYAKWGGLVCILAVLGYYMCLGIWNFLEKLHRWNHCHVRVKICDKGREVELEALIDTGNCLYDSKSGKPISIISYRSCKDFLHVETPFSYVFLHTLGNKASCIPVICVEKLQILGENERVFYQVLLAISDAELSQNGNYQVILNPNLF